VASRISIVIVTWNTLKFLPKCLSSVYHETITHPIEVFVVDNASTDSTSEMVAREYPGAILIRNGENFGFAKGNNIALRRILEEGRADYILLLNSDVVVQERALDKLADYLDQHPEAGGVSPSLILPNGSFQTGPGGYLPTVPSALHYFFFFFKLFPDHTRPLFIDSTYFAGRRTPRRVEWLSGACLLVRRTAVEKTGVLNEDYFLYAEDIDWGRRLTTNGFPLFFLPTAAVEHFQGMTTRMKYKQINTKWLKSLFSYVRYEHGKAKAFLFRLIAAGGFALRALLHTIAFLFRWDRATGLKVAENAVFMIFSLTGRPK
jgi:N-acetylglucosaminyl-diphospho-decaprenol L-rhamnosyltransferase